MIFLDTSGVYALADLDDENHNEAVKLFDLALRKNKTIVVSNYIIVESAALLQRRLGLNTALTFLDESKGFVRIWVDEDLHDQATKKLTETNSSKISFVDILSFLVMKKEGIRQYIGFDKHFEEAGFERYGRE